MARVGRKCAANGNAQPIRLMQFPSDPIIHRADRPSTREYNAAMFPVHDKARWLADYRDTAEALERIAARELAEMPDEEALRRISGGHSRPAFSSRKTGGS